MIWSLLSSAIAVAAFLMVGWYNDMERATLLLIFAVFSVGGLACGIIGYRSDRTGINSAISKLAILVNGGLFVVGILLDGFAPGPLMVQYPALECSTKNARFVRELVRRGHVRENGLNGSVDELISRGETEHWIEPRDRFLTTWCNLKPTEAPARLPRGLSCLSHKFHFAYDGRVLKIPSNKRFSED